jgi:hypothetical protein
MKIKPRIQNQDEKISKYRNKTYELNEIQITRELLEFWQKLVHLPNLSEYNYNENKMS